jgi:hypothetical protein
VLYNVEELHQPLKKERRIKQKTTKLYKKGRTKNLELNPTLQPFLERAGIFLLHSVADQSDFLGVNGFPRLKRGIDIIEDLVVLNNPNPPS